jgi:hypothetical protein
VATFLVVLLRSGPQWDSSLLRVEAIEPWTIRLDGRAAR